MDHETGPSVAVVVCGYTTVRLEMLLAAVTEARAQADGPGDEVVVVADHAEELARQVRAALPPAVAVVFNTGRRGLSSARNTGVAATGADVVVFLDDDALPRPGMIRAVRERFADPSVVLVGGAVHPQWEGGRAPRWFPAEFGWVVGCDYRGMAGHGESIRNPIGACMAVRRVALEAAGGFSSELGRVGALPVGCEETLLGIRVRQHMPGARSVRDEGFAVDHYVPASRQRVHYFSRRCFHEGRSKAVLARLVGPGAGLSSERDYVARTLGAALLRESAGTLRGDATAPLRAALVLTGLLMTTLGLLSAPTNVTHRD